MRAKHIECCFMFGLVWSIGSTGVETGQTAFLEYLVNIVADLGVIEAEWEGVSNALQVRILPRGDTSSWYLGRPIVALLSGWGM